MSEGELPPTSGDPKKPAPEIADVDLLFQEDAPPAKQPNDLGTLPSADSAGVFEVVETAESHLVPPRLPSWVAEETEAGKAPADGPVSPRRASAQPSGSPHPSSPTSRDRPSETARDREFKSASDSVFAGAADVDQIWSRKEEWGLTILILAGWTFSLLGILYLTLVAEYFTLAFMVLVLGGFVWLYLCYPILITLEIPVRLTPESAVKDYYGSLSHHMPHYRRMWLLLSRQAKSTPHFGSYEGFRAYWKARVNDLKQQGHAGPTTPLLFQVENFISEQSAGKTIVNARFVVNVFVRGRRDEGPIATVPLRIDLVRGPDKMFYLCNGTLPDPPAEQP